MVPRSLEQLMPGGVPEFWPEALEIIRAAPIGFLATASGEQPTVRAVTPAYQGITAYIACDPSTIMVRDIRLNPLVDLLHWYKDFRHVGLRGRGSLVDDPAVKREMWDQFGYDLSDFFGDDGFDYGLIKIDPFRISMTSLQRIAAGKPPLVWRSR